MKTRLAKWAEDKDAQAWVFAERVALAQMSLEAATSETASDWAWVQRWVASDSTAKGSFRAMCDAFNLNSDAVRQSLKKSVGAPA